MTDVAKIQRWEKKKGNWYPWPSEEVLLGLAAGILGRGRTREKGVVGGEHIGTRDDK
jgi:hypothetical protein